MTDHAALIVSGGGLIAVGAWMLLAGDAWGALPMILGCLLLGMLKLPNREADAAGKVSARHEAQTERRLDRMEKEASRRTDRAEEHEERAEDKEREGRRPTLPMNKPKIMREDDKA